MSGGRIPHHGSQGTGCDLLGPDAHPSRSGPPAIRPGLKRPNVPDLDYVRRDPIEGGWYQLVCLERRFRKFDPHQGNYTQLIRALTALIFVAIAHAYDIGLG